MDKGKVAVLLSGGVDSSVATALLVEQGYEVVGIFGHSWSQPITGVEHCPWIKDRQMAAQVAAQLGIKFYALDVQVEYKHQVVDYFFAEYRAGRTPNPDVLCNREIKFGVLYQAARRLGADWVATGHYARVTRKNRNKLIENGNEYRDGKIENSNKSNFQSPISIPISNFQQLISGTKLLRGTDPAKDQSYFLWNVRREVLPQLLFPVGGKTKTKVRALARRFKLPTADRPDSQGICFLGPVSVRQFLASKIKSKIGPVTLEDGTAVGEHQGVWFYTLGQRHGFSVNAKLGSNRPPLYIIRKDVQRNRLVVGPRSAANLSALTVTTAEINWLVSNPRFYSRKQLQAQVRYRQKAVNCQIEINGSTVTTTFSRPVLAPTEGQSIVWYDGDIVLGGGVIVR